MPEIYCSPSLLRSFLRPLLEGLQDVLSCDLTLHLSAIPKASNLVTGELWKYSVDGTWQRLLFLLFQCAMKADWVQLGFKVPAVSLLPARMAWEPHLSLRQHS